MKSNDCGLASKHIAGYKTKNCGCDEYKHLVAQKATTMFDRGTVQGLKSIGKLIKKEYR